MHENCPYYLVLYIFKDMQSVLNIKTLVLYFYMQSVLIILCFFCKVSLLCSALYSKCPYYSVLLYTQCPYYLVLYMQRFLTI